jgi:hypothetical protein
MCNEHDERRVKTLSEEHIEVDVAVDDVQPKEGFEDALSPDDLGFGTPEVKRIRIGRTQVDPTVQRHLDQSRVNSMVANFRREGLGVVTVNVRKDGGVYVVDGQHRRATLLARGEEDAMVDANVYMNLTLAQEATLFVLLNTTKQPNPVDIFKARLVAGHAPTHRMYRILTSRNWKITLQPGEYRFAAVRTMENLFRMDEAVTERVIDILTKAWDGAPNSMDYRIMAGLGHLLMRYSEQVDDARMAKKLKDYPSGPTGVVSASVTFRSTMRNKARDAVAFVLTNAYNQGKRTEDMLPQWDTRRPD